MSRHPAARAALLAASAASALACAARARTPQPQDAGGAPIAFVDVAVAPMDREARLEHQTVIVRGDRVAALGPTAALPVPANALRIDGRGRTLMPGLTDAHVHLVSPIELPLYLAHGVTSVFNLHGHPAHLAWRRAVEEGRLVGPAIRTAGPAFASKLTPAEAVRRVDEQADAGYDAVKIYFQVGAEEYAPLMARARARGLRVTGHVARAVGFDATLRAGQSIAHAEEIIYSFFNPKNDGEVDSAILDPARIPEAARRIAAAGVFVTPTLCTYRDIIRQATDLRAYLAGPALASLAPWVRAALEPGVNKYDGRYAPATLERMRSAMAFQRLLVRELARAGVPLLTGTDATSIGPVAGAAIHDELEELVRAGLTPYQALRAATANAAASFGQGGEAGTVAPGRFADLVLLDGDPLADVGATRRVAGVVARGRWLDGDALRAAEAAVPDAYRRELAEAVRLIRDDPRRAGEFLRGRDPTGGLAGAGLVEVASRPGSAGLPALLRRLRREAPEVASEEAVNTLGYALLAAKVGPLALAVFEANVADFPRSANALDSLAEAHARLGDRAESVRLYRMALALDPTYANAEAAKRIVAGSPGR